MGYGDEVMATGMARGARGRGKRIAFGDGKRIVWGPWCAEVFRGNPNIAKPGSEGAPDIEWVAHYKGHRLYNKMGRGRWVWNYEFRATPGEIFFDDAELRRAEGAGEGFVVIEPHVPAHKSVAPNKDWGFEKFQRVAELLAGAGVRVCQLGDGTRPALQGVEFVRTSSYRHALSVLSRADLYVGPEGGLHHGAAALKVPGVVMFGGFIPPSVTGYDIHTNMTGDAGEACGSLAACDHCRKAMASISVDEVWQAVRRYL